jgi:hypothetical protein
LKNKPRKQSERSNFMILTSPSLYNSVHTVRALNLNTRCNRTLQYNTRKQVLKQTACFLCDSCFF